MAKPLAPHKQEMLPALPARITKKSLHGLADNTVSRLLDEGDPFTLAEAMAAMECFIKQVRQDERFVQLIRDELSKHGGELKMPSGARLEACEAGIQYQYSGNGEWLQLQQQIEHLTKQKKELEERLRTIPEGNQYVDEETGEVIEGALKRSKSTYRITLAAR